MSNKAPKKPVDLASCAMYEAIDFQNLSPEDITEYDAGGFTLLHHVARHGMWDKLPKALQNPKYWKESKDGDTIYISAYYGDRQEWIDKKTLSESEILKRNKQGEFVAWMATKNRRLYMLPKKIITEKVLKQKIQRNNTNKTPTLLIHEIARCEQMSAIPKKFLTEELLSVPNERGESVYHILALDRSVKSIPNELWTKKALTLKDDTGKTPLHSIAESFAHIIPKDITLEDITSKDSTGDTPLHAWAKGFGWVNIPNKFLTNQTLHLKGTFGESPLGLLLSRYKNGWGSGTHEVEKLMKPKITHVLSTLDDDCLKKIQKDSDPAINSLAHKELAKRKTLKKLNERGHNTLEI